VKAIIGCSVREDVSVTLSVSAILSVSAMLSAASITSPFDETVSGISSSAVGSPSSDGASEYPEYVVCGYEVDICGIPVCSFAYPSVFMLSVELCGVVYVIGAVVVTVVVVVVSGADVSGFVVVVVTLVVVVSALELSLLVGIAIAPY